MEWWLILIIIFLALIILMAVGVPVAFAFLAINIVVTIQGFFLLGRVYDQLTPALRIPVSFPYASVPVSFLFMVLYGVSDVLKLFVDRTNAMGG